MNKVSNDIVRDFFKQVAKYSLLTHEQEQKLFVQYNEGRKADKLLASCSNLSDDEKALAINTSRRGKKAKDLLFKSNLRLVADIAKDYQNRGVDFIDLIQEGCIGLNTGIQKFDVSTGYKASTYVYWWVKQGITRAVANQSRTIRLPVHFVEKLNKCKKATKQLSEKLGRSPTLLEIAEKMQVDPEELGYMLDKSRNISSLDYQVGEKKESTLVEFIADDRVSTVEFVESESDKEFLEELLSCLEKRSRQMIELKYGIGCNHPHSLSEIAEVFGISRERARQITNAAIKKMKQRRERLENSAVLDAQLAKRKFYESRRSA